MRNTFKRFIAKVDKNTSNVRCERMTGCNKCAYGGIRINGNKISTHRWTYEHFIIPIPKGVCVCHRFDNPRRVNDRHNATTTSMVSKADLHTILRCEHNDGAKLTSEDDKISRLKYAKWVSITTSSNEYGVTYATMRNALWRTLRSRVK
jgi:hypothetical protein